MRLRIMRAVLASVLLVAILGSFAARSDAARLITGSGSSCAFGAGSILNCWGNDFTRFDSSETMLPPTPMTAFPTATSVTASYNSLCAVLLDSALSCVGTNSYGELGIGSADENLRASPVTPMGLESGVREVFAGFAGYCALLTSGALKCWGYNARGQLGAGWLGDGTVDGAVVPEQVVGLTSGVTDVSRGVETTCAIVGRLRTVKCWGSNEFGQLGIGRTGNPDVGLRGYGGFSVPVKVKRLKGPASDIAVSLEATCIIGSKSRTSCWGSNRRGQLGSPTGKSRVYPTRLRLPIEPVELVAGDRFFCARSATGRVACWGDNAFGQIGTGKRGLRARPTSVRGLGGRAIAIAAGGDSVCAGLDTGGVACWGDVGPTVGPSYKVNWSPVPRIVHGAEFAG